MKKIKNILLEFKGYIITIILVLIIFNINLPYYIMAPGGIIPISDRVEVSNNKDTKGSINLLYVTQYNGNVSSLLMSLFMPEWKVEKLSNEQLSNETLEEIHTRNKIMLDNSIQNAIFVAYNSLGKEIKINNKRNIVIGTTNDNEIKINDEILKINDIEVESVDTIKEVIKDTNISDKVKLTVKRNDKELELYVPVTLSNNYKVLGIVVITNYDYELDPKINIKFKESESGASGGLMTAVTIYNAISDEDITKGLNIGGTGTIDINGNVGEIDGVNYKIMGAAKNKLDVVFVPKANYEEAINTKNKYNYNLEIISVDKFNDVIEYLKNYKK